ncbi:hypothetical protein Lal_00049703 [Lupinus albus]|uniref:DUF7887 domain-containing protein n=1 Tax=Lupinus albus TaxID=3870 RepID=A0A6A5LXX5_LUPAL|nr:hypothetical protein Lalb_Chr12g0198851 [Lupinus albus]KAF1867274.1 hypothetical protein Lal_00049703 [Lupinus albus]
MAITGRSCSVIYLTSYLSATNHGSKFGTSTIFAKKKEFIKNQPFFKLNISKSLFARTAIGVLGLGFIDAGYSGDWSRIGVITTQSEELLKVAAFVVVPFCIFLIFSLPNDSDS